MVAQPENRFGRARLDRLTQPAALENADVGRRELAPPEEVGADAPAAAPTGAASALGRARRATAPTSADTNPIAAITVQPRSKAVSAAAGVAGEPTTATKIDTPIANPT